jgi:hypothetical protein
MSRCLYCLDHLNQYVLIIQELEQLWMSKVEAINRSNVELGVSTLFQNILHLGIKL